MKKILVFGCKRTGKALYLMLTKNTTNEVWLYDDDITSCDPFFKNTGKLLSMYVVKDVIDTFDLLVFSPSIKRDNWLLQLARQKGLTVLNEFEFCFLQNKAKSLCVSGTDGKTTTVKMIESILKEASKSFKVAGNVGLPLAECCCDLTKNDILVAEVSSFMLQDSALITPNIAVITNIAVDHVDWHKSFKNYCIAKSNLVKFLSKDSVVLLNADDNNSGFLELQTCATVYKVSLEKKVVGAFLFEGALWTNLYGKEEKILDIKDIKVFGRHNLSNALFAILACINLGVDKEDIRKGLKGFWGVPHRLQKLFKHKKVLFVNDSKATSVHATVSAIESFDCKNVGLILGGRKKEEDFERIFDAKNFSNVRCVATFGESKNEIFDLLKKRKTLNCFLGENLRDAVEQVFKFLKTNGGVLLFSPACLSFDEYENFEERGVDFCNIAKEIKNGKVEV